MLDKKMIVKEISVLHYLLLTTSKVLIGMGLGVIVATHYYYLQPYWYLILIIGALILIPTLYHLMRAEEKEEISLTKKLKK